VRATTPTTVAPTTPAGTATTSASQPSSTGARSTGTPGPVVPALADEPDLQTQSSNVPEVGLFGLGILFVALIVIGIVVVRRRAHTHG
jgi:hypothetical protein